MRTFYATSEVPADFGPSAVTIGKFDGVHIGHRQVLARLVDIAAQRRLTSVVLTFDRHPRAFLDPSRSPSALIGNRQKLELIESLGVDAAFMATFDAAFSAISAEQFATSILGAALNARVVLVGRDFRFGARGAGNVDVLREYGRSVGFEVVVIDDVALDRGQRASSTEARERIERGDVSGAADILGGLHTLRGLVVEGLKRGRTLGYPTANLSPDLEGMIPADGVYAAWLTVDGKRYPSAVSVGNNPTFAGVAQKQVEAHVLDEHLDLYGRTVELAFVERVRTMEAFADVEKLIAQMRSDEANVRDVLGVGSPRT